MKKIVLLIICSLLILSLSACGFESVDKHEKREKAEAESIKELQSETTETETAAVSATQTETDKNGMVSNNISPTKGGQVSGNSTPAQTTAPSSGNNNAADTKVTVTLTVKCTKVLNYPGLNVSWPSSGYWLQNQSVTIDTKNGDTVWDVMYNAQLLKLLTLSYESSFSYGGKYITAINGLKEKDCGVESGWKYTLNGEDVTGISKVHVKNGDNIVWYYVLRQDDKDE